jgi:hypothetical protein
MQSIYRHAQNRPRGDGLSRALQSFGSPTGDGFTWCVRTAFPRELLQLREFFASHGTNGGGGYRRDQELPASPSDYGSNLPVAAKQITRKMEEDEYQLWLKKTSSAGIRVGPQFLGGLERAGVAGLPSLITIPSWCPAALAAASLPGFLRDPYCVRTSNRRDSK